MTPITIPEDCKSLVAFVKPTIVGGITLSEDGSQIVEWSFTPSPPTSDTLKEVLTTIAFTQVRDTRAVLFNASDMVGRRCFKAAVPYPKEWLAYDQALRDAPQQADITAIAWPTAPAMPVGI